MLTQNTVHAHTTRRTQEAEAELTDEEREERRVQKANDRAAEALRKVCACEVLYIVPIQN